MKTLLSLIALSCAAISVFPSAVAAETAATVKPVSEKNKKPPVKKTTRAKKAAEPQDATISSDDDGEPDIASSEAVDYSCELGNKLTIYTNKDDDKHVALRWNKRLMRMTRVDTTTGANRFENRKVGLVWLGIPAKGILLDSKKGQQLANECKNAEQMAPKIPAVSNVHSNAQEYLS